LTNKPLDHELFEIIIIGADYLIAFKNIKGNYIGIEDNEKSELKLISELTLFALF